MAVFLPPDFHCASSSGSQFSMTCERDMRSTPSLS